MLSSKLTVSAHILTLLAMSAGEPMTSERIAASVNTNPVVIRRLLGALRGAGFVESHGGPGGGWRLAIPASNITLSDVLSCVEPRRDSIALHTAEPNPRCRVGRHIGGVLQGVYREAEREFHATLARTSIARLLERVKRQS